MNALARRSILSPAGLFTLASSDGLQVGLCQPYLREVPANYGLERLARAFMKSPRPSLSDLFMQGDAVVAQWIFVLGMLIAPVGLIWVVVLDILLDLLGDDHHSQDKRQGFASPKQRNGFEPHITHPGSQRSLPDNGT